MSTMQVFKITGVCNFEGMEEDAPCTCYPDLCAECIIDQCEYFSMYEGELDEDFFDEE